MSEPQDLFDESHRLGEARIRLAGSISSPEEWKTRWTEPAQPFPFVLSNWRQCICYSVEDYAAYVERP